MDDQLGFENGFEETQKAERALSEKNCRKY